MQELKSQKEKIRNIGVPIPKRGRKIRYCCPQCSFLHIHQANVKAVEALGDEHFNCVVVALQG